MAFYIWASLINGVAATIFGLIVYFKNRKALSNKIFGLLTLGLAIWCYSYFAWLITKDRTVALFWSRMLNLGATLIPIFYLHWILVLLNLNKKKKKLLIFGYLTTLLFVFFTFSPFYIKEVKQVLSFPYWPQAGPLYICYLIVGWLGMVGYGFYQLLKAHKIAIGHKRAQIKYVILGSIIGFAGGATNFPLMFGISIFPPFGNPLVAFYPIIFGYAVVKYRLMDIRIVMGKAMIYVFSFATVIGLGFLLMYLNNLLAVPLSFNIIGSLTLVICIFLFQVFFKIYERLASKYFYYTFYSYQKVLTELGEKLTGILNLKTLTNLLVETLISTMKLDRTVILQKRETGDYTILKNIGFQEENGISLVRDNFLTRYLESSKKPLVYEEISLIQRDTENKEEKQNLEKLKQNMKRIEANVCLPLFQKEKLIAMIILGKKISNDAFSKEDIDLLIALSSQSSIAFQNALLYSQVQDFSQNLQEKVDEQTKELRQAYEELKRVDEAKSEFISMASHQLRTPLASIKGYISMILDGDYGKIGEKAKSKLKNVFQSNERLIKIVNELLDISRIELGKIELDKTETQIENLVKSCYEEIRTEADKKKLKIVFKKPKILLSKLNIDKLKIRQAILNLIDNAIRYTKKGKIEISFQKKPNSILISIKDTGEGLSKKEQKEIFEGFIRGSAGTTFFIEGVGLGLHVAKKYVQLHQGKIWAESPGKGKGSTFYVELPIK